MKSRARPPASLAVALALVAVAGLACAGSPVAREPLTAFPQSDVAIESGGHRHAFRVWVADTPERRSQGLMSVKSLDAGRGMLFLFETPQFAAFWMKDTPVSLDMLFIARDGRITNIGERTRPFSTLPVESDGPIVAVLEVLAGTAARLGIRPGDRVVHPALGGPPER